MNYFELLKAKHGLPVSDAYTALLGKKLQGGDYPVTEIFGQLPFSFLSRGASISEWTLYGKTSQNGTPTPTAPIPVLGVGDRTANLFDSKKSTLHTDISASTGNTSYSPNRAISDFIAITESTEYYFTGITTYCFFDANKQRISGANTQSNPNFVQVSGNGAAYVRFAYFIENADTVMLNLGSTALPYEPYGHKIPITSAGQTIPVYLGQTQTVRRIKKKVFTGQEAWAINAETGTFYTFAISDFFSTTGTTCVCSHYAAQNNVSGVAEVRNKRICFRTATNKQLYLKDSDFDSTNALKSYLTEQYANGTPVTVWYVLAEPATGIVNEPLMKIGDYADELRSTDAGVAIPTAVGTNTLDTDTSVHGDARIKGRIKETEDSAMSDLLNLMEGM